MENEATSGGTPIEVARRGELSPISLRREGARAASREKVRQWRRPSIPKGQTSVWIYSVAISVMGWMRSYAIILLRLTSLLSAAVLLDQYWLRMLSIVM